MQAEFYEVEEEEEEDNDYYQEENDYYQVIDSDHSFSSSEDLNDLRDIPNYHFYDERYDEDLQEDLEGVTRERVAVPEQNFPSNWYEQLFNARNIQDLPERKIAINKVQKEFQKSALESVRTLVEEMHVEKQHRSMLDVEGLGLAGGKKSYRDGILFKIASDVKIKNRWLHGKTNRNDEIAYKMPSQELKGYKAIESANVDGVLLPLFCVIDLYGFRVSCISIIPTNLIQGSNDGGKNILYDEREEIQGKLQAVANHIGLRAQKILVENSLCDFFFALDVEVHQTTRSNDIWLLDCERVMPPEKPRVGLCNFFRPEFLQLYGTPLSSNAFRISLQKNDDSSLEMKATEYLHQTLIPQCAKNITEQFRLHGDDALCLKDVLHASGINCRYLGRVRSFIPVEELHLRQLFLCEIIARTLKSKLLQEWRSTYYNWRMFHCLNSFVNRCQNFWLHNMEFCILEKFEDALTHEEVTLGRNLAETIDLQYTCFHRFCELCNVKLAHPHLPLFQQDLRPEMVLSISPKIRSLYFIE